MKDAITPTGTTLEVCNPYFQYGLEGKIEDVEDSLYRVIGWMDDELWVAPVEDLSEQFSINPRHFLPVLLPFSALTTALEDGTVPAIEVARLLGRAPLLGDYELRYHPTAGIGETASIEVYIDGTNRGRLVDEWEATGAWAILKVAAYLRSKHFAVGLEAHQYIPKTPAAAATPIQEGEPG